MTPTPERKPLAVMESREPHSIRFSPQEWEAICFGARTRGLEPAVFTRMLALHALTIAQAPTPVEASLGMLSTSRQMLAGSTRTRRF